MNARRLLPEAASTVRGAEAVFEEAKNWFWTQALAYNGQIWVGCLDGNVYVLDADDLGYVDKVETDGMVYAPPVSFDGMVVVGSQDGWIYIINPETRDFEAYAVDSKTYEPVKAPEKPKNNPVPDLCPDVCRRGQRHTVFPRSGNGNNQRRGSMLWH